MHIMVSEQGANIGGQLYISFVKWRFSKAFIFSIVKQIKPDFRYFIKTGACFIGTKYQDDMMRREAALLSLSQTMRIGKEQTSSQPMFSSACTSATYGSSLMSRRKNQVMKFVKRIALSMKYRDTSILIHETFDTSTMVLNITFSTSN